MEKGNLLTGFVVGLALIFPVQNVMAAGKVTPAGNVSATGNVTPATKDAPAGNVTSADSLKKSDNTDNMDTSQRLTPEASLKRLIDGNKRFMKDKTICPERNQERRLETVAKQKPFAVIVGCSDSRIPPEFAFDQGIGDIFVVRIAGNVVSALEIDSVEYSALYNDSSIIMVLGHQNCGAVDAVMANNTKDIESIAELIKPALHNASKEKMTLEEAIIANVKNSVARIKRSRPISALIKEGKISVVGAYYSLETGEARIVTDNGSK